MHGRHSEDSKKTVTRLAVAYNLHSVVWNAIRLACHFCNLIEKKYRDWRIIEHLVRFIFKRKIRLTCLSILNFCILYNAVRLDLVR